MNRNNKILIYLICIIAILILALIIVISNFTSKISSLKKDFKDSLNDNNEMHQDWFMENCKCLEWNGTRFCQEGFTLKDNMCLKDKIFTNFMTRCSKYTCPEYPLNFTEEK